MSSGLRRTPGLKIPRVPYAGMTRIRFQGSLPHAGDSQPFWAPRAKERGRILEGSLTARQSRRGEQLGDSNLVFRDPYAGLHVRLDIRLGRSTASLDNR